MNFKKVNPDGVEKHVSVRQEIYMRRRNRS